MTEQDMKEFAAALAARYFHVKEEYTLTTRHFLIMDVANTPAEKFQTARIIAERAYARWMLFNDVINDLPIEIMQLFQKEYEQYTTK
ncbi:hypothetical protein J27TS7_10570 [Paenibacillus dendritiformis]|uniref:hypothetical protein n=1 Tax=Paenibacillus dendritiformis TaxID=130049 RepID=UPI001B0F423F|nr:hypothetical protein [Paenibacillus dendritiformis]GIO71543.1 hypothetical protein J27TS7_10570 [Paenibacillus dendritiformis]